MKVFEVTTERHEDDETITTVQYITCSTDKITDVSNYYACLCEQSEQDLTCVRAVLTVVEHITV